MDEFELMLKAPLEHAGATITVLRLREPRAGELARAADAPDAVSSRIALIAAITGIDANAIRELGARDLMAASSYLGRFTVEPDNGAEEGEIELRLTLARPIQLGDGDNGLTLSEIELREPRAGELAACANAGNGIRMDLKLLTVMLKKPTSLLEQMSARDFIEVRRFFGSFTGVGPVNG
jgi:Phage tail assembly chaperone proteins, E, or 41 or 14